MHDELRRLVKARWGKFADQRAEEHAANAARILADFAKRKLILDAWRQTLAAYLDYARSLCDELAKIWACAIQKSEGRFTSEDVTFVEREIAAMIPAHREAAVREARHSDSGSGIPVDIVQGIDRWAAGTIGSIRRDLEIRVGESTLDEKAEERERLSVEAKEFHLWLRILLGRRLQHRPARLIYAWGVVVFAVVGAWDVVVPWLRPFFEFLVRRLKS